MQSVSSGVIHGTAQPEAAPQSNCRGCCPAEAEASCSSPAPVQAKQCGSAMLLCHGLISPSSTSGEACTALVTSSIWAAVQLLAKECRGAPFQQTPTRMLGEWGPSPSTAIPTSAFLRAGASLTPSPLHAARAWAHIQVLSCLPGSQCKTWHQRSGPRQCGASG